MDQLDAPPRHMASHQTASIHNATRPFSPWVPTPTPSRTVHAFPGDKPNPPPHASLLTAYQHAEDDSGSTTVWDSEEQESEGWGSDDEWWGIGKIAPFRQGARPSEETMQDEMNRIVQRSRGRGDNYRPIEETHAQHVFEGSHGTVVLYYIDRDKAWNDAMKQRSEGAPQPRLDSYLWISPRTSCGCMCGCTI